MAKTSKVVKNEQRIKMVEQYRALRTELKKVIKSASSTDDQKDEAWVKLRKIPRDANPNRVRNRCHLSGRPRGYYRKFGLSRLAVREKAVRGELPGVTKASW